MDFKIKIVQAKNFDIKIVSVAFSSKQVFKINLGDIIKLIGVNLFYKDTAAIQIPSIQNLDTDYSCNSSTLSSNSEEFQLWWKDAILLRNI